MLLTGNFNLTNPKYQGSQYSCLVQTGVTGICGKKLRKPNKFPQHKIIVDNAVRLAWINKDVRNLSVYRSAGQLNAIFSIAPIHVELLLRVIWIWKKLDFKINPINGNHFFLVLKDSSFKSAHANAHVNLNSIDRYFPCASWLQFVKATNSLAGLKVITSRNAPIKC